MDLALPAPRTPDPAAAPPLRWAVVGTGRIAGLFVDAVHAHTRQVVTAVFSRDQTRRAAFAAQHGVPAALGSLEELVAQRDVDVVYVAVPHSAHLQVAQAALEAGQHVLVEKPFAADAEQALAIAQAAASADRLAMEAMWTRYLPQTDVVRQLLTDGALGQVHLVNADFGFSARMDPTSRLWDPALAGGALLDAGVYPVSFASSVLGTPSRITARGQLASTGVDARASLLLEHPRGASALLATSMVSALPTEAVITGSTGRLRVLGPFYGPSGLELTRGPHGHEQSTRWVDDRFATVHEGLAHQAAALAAYVAEGRRESPVHTLAETVSVLETIDEARRQVSAAAVP